MFGCGFSSGLFASSKETKHQPHDAFNKADGMDRSYLHPALPVALFRDRHFFQIMAKMEAMPGRTNSWRIAPKRTRRIYLNSSRFTDHQLALRNERRTKHTLFNLGKRIGVANNAPTRCHIVQRFPRVRTPGHSTRAVDTGFACPSVRIRCFHSASRRSFLPPTKPLHRDGQSACRTTTPTPIHWRRSTTALANASGSFLERTL